MEKTFKIVIILAVLLTSISLSYYYVFYLPKHLALVFEQQKQLTADKTDSLQKCLNLAEQNYLFEQDTVCEQAGQSAGCVQFIGSPKDVEFTKIMQDDKQICSNLYK